MLATIQLTEFRPLSPSISCYLSNIKLAYTIVLSINLS